ncbi:hypothetical protein HPB48_003262 [Haemaphysalis longicornis]|uniref:diacylglycerol kinase (ATP) n=1 Tax=Haemaphysalis longicornis TaxID=44386 RepID=A0A9J6H2Q2_HAELO|nr:hypothetical protein HPB48_003262 [Haemaphysalis longicornis]
MASAAAILTPYTRREERGGGEEGAQGSMKRREARATATNRRTAPRLAACMLHPKQHRSPRALSRSPCDASSEKKNECLPILGQRNDTVSFEAPAREKKCFWRENWATRELATNPQHLNGAALMRCSGGKRFGYCCAWLVRGIKSVGERVAETLKIGGDPLRGISSRTATPGRICGLFPITNTLPKPRIAPVLSYYGIFKKKYQLGILTTAFFPEVFGSVHCVHVQCQQNQSARKRDRGIVCEYCVHLECQDFSVADCKQCATYAPSRNKPSVMQFHHWREGNLPANSKCQQCKKTCWSAECLAGMRCEWCGITAHATCYRSLSQECNFGCLESIMLPPAAVSIPRTDVPLETIIGVEMRRRETLARATYPSIDPNEKELGDFMPVQSLTRREGKRPAIFLRYRPPNPDQGYVKVFPGKLRSADIYRVIQVTSDTSVEEIMIQALEKFGLDSSDINKFRLSEVTLDKGSVHERVMDNQEGPWELLRNIARESIRQKDLTRFYLQQKEDCYSSSVALFVGNMPPNLSQRQYEKILVDLLGKREYPTQHFVPF